MTCTCRGKSAFSWASCNCPSVFAKDSTFTAGAKTGRTASQLATEAVDRFEQANGRSLGTVAGISDKADKETAQRQDQRRLQAKAPSKYAQASFKRVQAKKGKA